MRTGVAIQRSNELVWGGLVWSWRYDVRALSIEVNAAGYLSFYRHRHTPVQGQIHKDKEQSAILKWEIDNVTVNYGIGTDTSGVVPTNFKRTRVWNPYEFKSVADIIDNLCDDISGTDPQTGKSWGGFFFYFEPYFKTSDTIGHRFYNTTDRHPYGSGLLLRQGKTCEFPEISVDGSGLASHAYAVGATDGEAQMTPFASARNMTLITRKGLPALDVVLNEGSAKESATLTYKCNTALSFGSAPVILPAAHTFPNVYSPLAARPGMLATCTTDDGFLNLSFAEYVVTKTSVAVEKDGSDRLSLDLVPAELFKETAT
ncbi:hypothetical protein ACIQU6_29100 [Streptomyces sp. NPDC090442]|uniref:hypothetical protein n=1 Tax=Streptomyces sp. NPDC090442 TaxID=3365962 RepID=UPI0037F33A00